MDVEGIWVHLDYRAVNSKDFTSASSFLTRERVEIRSPLTSLPISHTADRPAIPQDQCAALQLSDLIKLDPSWFLPQGRGWSQGRRPSGPRSCLPPRPPWCAAPSWRDPCEGLCGGVEPHAPSSDSQHCRGWARGCLGVRLCPEPAPGSPPGWHAEIQA